GVHLLDVLRRDPLRRVEALDLAGDARGAAGGAEIGDRADARAPVHDPLPGRSQVVAERRQDAEAGDDDATLGHVDSWTVARAANRRAENARGRISGPGLSRCGLWPQWTHQALTCALM